MFFFNPVWRTPEINIRTDILRAKVIGATSLVYKYNLYKRFLFLLSETIDFNVLLPLTNLKKYTIQHTGIENVSLDAGNLLSLEPSELTRVTFNIASTLITLTVTSHFLYLVHGLTDETNEEICFQESEKERRKKEEEINGTTRRKSQIKRNGSLVDIYFFPISLFPWQDLLQQKNITSNRN